MRDHKDLQCVTAVSTIGGGVSATGKRPVANCTIRLGALAQGRERVLTAGSYDIVAQPETTRNDVGVRSLRRAGSPPAARLSEAVNDRAGFESG